MDHFFDIISRAYKGYSSYLWKDILHPLNNGGSYFYLLIVVSLFAWLLEIFVPWRKKQAIFRKDFFLDTFYMFFNFFIFNLLIYIALSSVTENYFQKLMTFFSLPANGIINLTILPLWIQFILYFIIADFIQWSIHIVLHKNKWLWRVHQVHHSVTEMGFAAHLRYHWVETLVYRTGLYIVLAWLLHFKLEHAFFLHAFTVLIGHLNHTNVKIDYGILKYILNNPRMHIWHHAKELPKSRPYGMNFGISLSLWDYLFKTAYVPHEGRDIPLGFPTVEKFPRGFFRQFIEPFTKSKNE